jgi:hypothetical protein
MIQQKATLVRPSDDIPWHWFVVNRSQHAINLEQKYILTEKILTQYEENPDELTSILYRYWDSIESYNEYIADPEVILYRTACKEYNDFVGIKLISNEFTEAE